MKAKLLATILMLAIVTAVTVCAVPMPANTVETAAEAEEIYAPSQATANVMAEATVVPGRNVYTGDTNVETFDGFTQEDVNAMFTWPSSTFSMTVANDDSHGAVIKGSYSGEADGWVTFYSLISYKLNRRAFYYIDYKLDPNSVGHVNNSENLEDTSWVINLIGTKKNFGIPVSQSETWLTAANNDEKCIWGDKLHSFNMKFASGGTVYVDNYALIPYYQITYKNIDKNGNSLGDDIVVYYLTDSSITVTDGKISGIATTYPIENRVLSCDDDTAFFGGWSTTQGGDAQAAVALDGEDIVLYPVWYDVTEETVLYETFEDVANGTYLSKYTEELGADNKAEQTVYKLLNMNTRGILSSATVIQGDQRTNMSVEDFGDGNSVLKVAKVSGYTSSWRMVTFRLYTSGTTGLTASQPGKYVLSCRYYIDKNDPSTYSSITGRIDIGNNTYPTVGKGNSVTKGDWHNFTQEFEVKNDGTLVYGTTSKEYLNSLVRFDLVNNYGTATGDVLYYVDDVMVTYEPSKYVTFNFFDSTGKAIKSMDILHYNKEGAILPKASELGLEYDIVYTVDGKKYYPGQHVVLDKTLTEVDVIVSNSNMIFYESFDSRDIDRLSSVYEGDKGFTPEYVSPLYDEIGYAPIIIGGDSGGNQSYKTTTESGRKVLAIKRFQKTDGLYSMYMESRFLGTGTYSYTITYKASGETLSNTNMNMQTKYLDTNINFAKDISSFPADKDGYRTVTYEIKVYDDADGVRKADFINSPGNVYSEKTFNRIMFYWWGPKVEASDETIYLDEISIEYKPFAPGEINLKSYRDIDPVGIRFASYVTDTQKAQSSEYGFIATRKVFLENAAATAGTGNYTDYLYIDNDDVMGTSTTLVTNSDGVAIVGACSYNGTVNRVYATDGSVFESSKYLGLNDAVTFFTGVVVGLNTDEQKDETFVVRPYIKIDGVYYFGTTYEASFNDVYSA